MIKSGQNIKVFHYGTTPSIGELQCVIFYDKLDQKYGLIFGGANNASSSLTLNRIQYINTITNTSGILSANLTSVNLGQGVVGDLQKNYIYIAGGGGAWTGSTYTEKTSIERINCSVTTVNASIRTDLSEKKLWLDTAKNSSDAGYFLGGCTNYTPRSVSDKIEKLVFSGETMSVLVAVLSVAKDKISSINNSALNLVYIAGGSNVANATLTTIDKFDTVTNTMVAFANTLITGVTRFSRSYNTTNAYFIGGRTSTASTSLIQKMPFDNETVASLGNKLILASQSTANTIDNNLSYTYLIGGSNEPLNIILDLVEKFSMSTETAMSVIMTLPIGASDIRGETI